MEEKFKYGIFDLDGTIVDSIHVYMDVFCEILKERYGIFDKDAKEHLYYLNSTGTPLNEQFKHVLEINGKPTTDVPEMAMDFFERVNAKDFILFDGTKFLLADLHKRGLKLFVSTGSEDRATIERLDKAGISKYFILILGSSRKEKGPWHIEEFARTAGVSARDFSKQAFYVGDGPYDMQIAKMFGIYAIGVAATVSKNLLIESGADAAVDKITDVGELNLFK